ncbi:MAG: hypothetical protein MEQ84_03410 [Mesorhizobium sp.]|nr:hypothetical protein [Mesorhizobium sp.]
MVDSSVDTLSIEDCHAAETSSERTVDAAPSRSAASALGPKLSSDEDPRKKEWASTLLLVQEACEAIKASEERVEGLERELEMANVQAREQQRQLNAKLNAAQQEILASNARAKVLETRAQEAEAWLARLSDAIVVGFGKQEKTET